MNYTGVVWGINDTLQTLLVAKYTGFLCAESIYDGLKVWWGFYLIHSTKQYAQFIGYCIYFVF